MERLKQIGFVLCTMLIVMVKSVSPDEDLGSVQAEPKKDAVLRENCETTVISESLVIVNCSHSLFGKNNELDRSNIDPRVTTLDLSNLKMTKYQFHDTNSVQGLVYLNLSNNELVEIDSLKTARLDSLRHLDLSNNKLREVPVCNVKLVTMKLDLNEIKTLDFVYTFKVYKNLKKLSMAENLIDLINTTCNAVYENDRLEYLDLSSNRIRLVEKCVFKQLPGLVHLNLSHNSIPLLSDGVLKTLTKLEKLDLSHNSIEYLAADSFEKLENLKFLDLSYNELQVIPSPLPMMDWFDISFNKISTLPESFSTVLYPQSVFFLGGNPFVCNCDLLWLKELFDTRKYLLKYLKNIDCAKFVPACEGPENLKGEVWDRLDDTAFECSGLEEKDKLAVKENVEQVLSGKDLIEAADVGENFVIVQWNIPPDLSNSVELTYHEFGKKKDKKEIVLPSSVTRFRLKKLKIGSPYVICLKVTLTKELKDCIEIVTKVTEEVTFRTKMVVFAKNVLVFCWTRYDIIALSIGLITLIYYFFLREN